MTWVFDDQLCTVGIRGLVWSKLVWTILIAASRHRLVSLLCDNGDQKATVDLDRPCVYNPYIMATRQIKEI